MRCNSTNFRPVIAKAFAVLALLMVARLGTAADENAGKLVKIVHVESGKVLGMDDASADDGFQAILFPDAATESLQWRISQEGDSIKLTNAKSGKVLDLFGAKKDADTPIIQYADKSLALNGVDRSHEPGGLENQRWVWEGAGKERRLKSKWSELVVDVDAEGRAIQR